MVKVEDGWCIYKVGRYWVAWTRHGPAKKRRVKAETAFQDAFEKWYEERDKDATK